MSRLQFLVMGALVALAACDAAGGRERVARSMTADRVANPETARFREVVVRGDVVCGEIDNKDDSGADVGFRRFIFNDVEQSLIDRQPRITDAELRKETNAASIASGRPYGSATALYHRQRAQDMRREMASDAAFDTLWALKCQ